MSARSSYGSARSISGAIHSGVPWNSERAEAKVEKRTRDMPKSAILTRHFSSTSMFGDFKSKWRIGGDRVWR